MITAFNTIFLYIFLLSLTYILYYLGNIIYFILLLRKEDVQMDKYLSIKESLVQNKKITILWFSVSFFLFYIFK